MMEYLKIILAGEISLIILWLLGIIFISKEFNLNPEHYENKFVSLVQMYVMVMIFIDVFGILSYLIWSII